MDIFTGSMGYDNRRLEPIQPVVDKDKTAIHGEAREPIIRRPVRDSDPDQDEESQEEEPQESPEEESGLQWLDTEVERPDVDSEGGDYHILDFRA